MIKKILLGLLLFVGLGFTSFSSAVQWKIINVGESGMIPNNSIYSLRPVSSSIGILEGGGVSFPAISNYIHWNNLWFWNLSGELNFIYSNNGYYILNEPEYGCLYSADGFYDFDGDVLSSGVCAGGGTLMQLSDFYRNPNFKGEMTRIGLITYYDVGVSMYGGFCFIYDGLNLSFCPASFPHEFVADNSYPGYSWLTDNPLNFDTSYIGNSPFDGGGGSSSGGSGSLVGPDISGNDIIDYFENNSVYNFNKSLCYVGIDDLSLNYGNGGSFVSGTGKTIFELYSSLYGSVPNLNYVGAWINSRLINYKEWFDNNGNPRFLTTFNSSNGLVSTYYDNLSFPFVNNPTAIYFMATNLYYSSVNSNGNEGYELAVYCDQILNGENAFPIDKSKAYYKNVVSWDYYQNSGKYYFDGSGNLVIRIDPGSGSIADAEFYRELFGSGGNSEEDFDDYFSAFTTFYDKLDTKFSNIDLSNTIGIIPNYILFILLLVVLFKLLKH